MSQTTARYIIIFLISLVLAFSTQMSRLDFDYDFENLFATDNPDLNFYREYRKIFGNDNDYLLLAFEPKQGVFDSLFLTNLEQIEREIGESDKVRYTLSPLSLKYLVRSPMGFLPVPYMKVKAREELISDSLRFQSKPEILKPFFGKSGKAILLLVRHKPMDDATSRKFVNEIEKLIKRSGIGIYYLAGKAKAQVEFVKYIQKDFGQFLAIGTLLIIAVLLILFRSIRIVLISFGVIVCVLVFTFGLMAIVGVPIDVMSALIPLILIIVSISDLVHFITKYKHEINQGVEYQRAIITTWRDIGRATLLTSATTAVGFFTLATAESIPIGNMGIFTGIGVMAAFGFTILLLPAIITLFPNAIKADSQAKSKIALPNHFLPKLLSIRWQVISAFTMLLIVSFWGIMKIEINAFLIDDLPEGAHIEASFRYFDEQMGGSKPWELNIAVADTSTQGIYDWRVIRELEKLEHYVQETYGVVGLSSPLTNLRIYEKALSGRFALPDSAEYVRWPKSWTISRKTDIMEKFNDASEKNGRFTGFVSDLGSKEAIRRDHLLQEFINKNIDSDVLKVRLTGTTYLIDRSHHIITGNLLWGLFVAIVIVAILAGAVFKNLWLVVVTLTCNVIPIAMIAGVLGIAGVTLSLSNAIIFAVSFGIAVDDTLHFVSKYQLERRSGKKHYESVASTLKSTGNAIIYTTIILVAGFSLFVFSSFQTSFAVGLLVSLTLVFALLTDLVLLPVLLCLPYKVSKN